MVFKPGISGNPSGKRIQPKQLKAILKKAGPEALYTIKELMLNGEDEPTRLAAAKYLADRAYGKPAQAVEVTGADGSNLIPGITVNILKPELPKPVVKAEKVPTTIEQALAEVKELSGSKD